MAKPKMVSVDPDDLRRLAARAAGLASDLSASYGAIDKSLAEVRLYWAGDKSDTFFKQVDKVKGDREKAIKALEAFCAGALASAPGEYEQLENEIRTDVQKLRNGQS